MKGTMNKPLIVFLAASLALVGANAYSATRQNLGTLNVTVVDQTGAVVPDASVYIYGEHKTHFVGGKDIPGTTSLSMPAGDYRISSAIIKKTGDYLDRYASYEAHIEVVPGDNITIRLTLRPLEDALAKLPNSDLRKIGVPMEVSQNLN